MIRIGAAGIPLSCKERTTKDGVIYTKNLGLTAMEVQFSRGFIAEEEAKDIKVVADACDIQMLVHTPYYINLIGDQRNVDMSTRKILASARLAHLMGAKAVVTHTGFYGSLSKKKALQRMVKNVRILRDTLKGEGIEVPIGIQTIGKKEVFGSLAEVAEVCKRVHGVIPVLDISHIHARGGGKLQEREDFQQVFDAIKDLELDWYLIELTGVTYNGEGELYHVPFRKGNMSIIKLMECILTNEFNATIISESPILEHDAVYAQILLDRAMEMTQ